MGKEKWRNGEGDIIKKGGKWSNREERENGSGRNTGGIEKGKMEMRVDIGEEGNKKKGWRKERGGVGTRNAS